MKVKRYIVNALPEALPIIRSELGIDAVILNTKEIRVGGFLGMFGKKKMEVIAAIESNTNASPAVRKQTPALKPAVSSAALSNFAAMVSSAAAVSAGAAVPEGGRLMEDAVPLKAAAAQPAVANRSSTENELINEIRDMKQWILKMSKQQQLKTWPEPVQALYERLVDQEIDIKWIDRLMAEVEERIQIREGSQPDKRLVWQSASSILNEWLKDFEGERIGEQTRVVHFVGPTGVGKTTSIAKLAAEQTLKAGRKVGFITSDTYRIAAVDQLRTYANILNVPLEVVFSPSEVTRAYKQLEDRELIFMDTAGRNFRHELPVSEVNSLLQSNDRSETYLVLSLTGKYKDMSAVAEHFVKYGIQSVLFTKQDETNAYGSILNLVMDFGLKPAYIAYGQTVPDDIMPFRTDSYVEKVLGAAGDE